MSRKPHEMEPESAVYKTLLESTKAIPWRIDWKTMQFTYIGPQIEPLLGWKRESWLTVNDWAERIHAEDRDNVVNFCVAQSQSGVDHEADYRALTADGRQVWIRDVVHVVRRNGEVEALIGFMFDITERKRNEEELLRLQQELATVAVRDMVTGLATARQLEQDIEREWASARRSAQPLSLVLVEIDFLDGYIAQNGTLAGDEALRRIARMLLLAGERPRDVVARDERNRFVLLLPETAAVAAQAIGERCRRLVLEAMLPNPQSRIAGYLTATVGVATRVPGADDVAGALATEAETALQQAVARGRNCVAG